MIPTDAISGRDLQDFWIKTSSSHPAFAAIARQTDFRAHWAAEAEELIARANNGDEEAKLVVGLVLAERLLE